jgi:hypothetical protein
MSHADSNSAPRVSVPVRGSGGLRAAALAPRAALQRPRANPNAPRDTVAKALTGSKYPRTPQVAIDQARRTRSGRLDLSVWRAAVASGVSRPDQLAVSFVSVVAPTRTYAGIVLAEPLRVLCVIGCGWCDRRRS